MSFYLPAGQSARKARIWQYLAFAGIFLIAPFFFVGGPGWTDGPLYKSAWNLGHILFFALLTLALQPWRIWTAWALWGFSTLVVVVLGLGIELLQYGVNRQVDWQDMLRNLLGLWAILAARPLASMAGAGRLMAWPIRIVVAALLTVDLGTTAGIAVQQYKVGQLLPALYDFSTPDPAPFWSGAIAPATRNAAGGSPGALRLSLSTTRYSGASLHNFPGDWRGYERLMLSLHNPHDHPIGLTLRINDVQHDEGANAFHDRFNTRLNLAPGDNRFHIDLDRIRNAPAGRTMNMRQVRRLLLFTSELTEPKTVYLRDIRLE